MRTLARRRRSEPFLATTRPLSPLAPRAAASAAVSIAAAAGRRASSSGPRAASPSAASSSVSATQVSHFDALASSWWDPHGPSRLLHLMNPLRHRFITQCLGPARTAPGAKLRILDIGCGGGIFAESAARQPWAHSVTAIDPTPQVIAVARAHARQDPALRAPGRLAYHHTALEDLPLPASPRHAYHLVTLFEVVEHVHHPAAFLARALAHLRPGGWLLGSTIARTRTSWLTTKLVAEELLALVPRGTHDWSRYIHPRELRAWAAARPDLDLAADRPDAWRQMGLVYLPGLGWMEIPGSEHWGNYFFAVRKSERL